MALNIILRKYWLRDNQYITRLKQRGLNNIQQICILYIFVLLQRRIISRDVYERISGMLIQLKITKIYLT